MAFGWFSFWQSDSETRDRSARQEVTFKPSLETLEARDVPSANPLDGLLGAFNPGVVPINFNFVNTAGGQATAIGQVGANAISVPLTLTATPGSNGAEILNLHLSPIHLDVLGLNVQTSNICLNITAQQGSGNLLGNLLYGVAHALDTNGGNLGNALSGLGPLGSLVFDLELATLLNGSLSSTTTGPSAIGPTSQATGLPPGADDLLHLSAGPVNLNLLGLNVALNNCANPAGPITVDVYTVPGSGELLGNLLTSVSNILNPNGSNLAGEQTLGNIVNTVLTVV
jgi:hypothetical protein